MYFTKDSNDKTIITRAPMFRKRALLKPFKDHQVTNQHTRMAMGPQFKATTVDDFWKAIPKDTTTTFQTEEVPSDIFTNIVPGTIKTRTFIKSIPTTTYSPYLPITRSSQDHQQQMNKINKTIDSINKKLNQIEKAKDPKSIQSKLTTITIEINNTNTTMKNLDITKLQSNDLTPLYSRMETLAQLFNRLGTHHGITVDITLFKPPTV